MSRKVVTTTINDNILNLAPYILILIVFLLTSHLLLFLHTTTSVDKILGYVLLVPFFISSGNNSDTVTLIRNNSGVTRL